MAMCFKPTFSLKHRGSDAAKGQFLHCVRPLLEDRVPHQKHLGMCASRFVVGKNLSAAPSIGKPRAAHGTNGSHGGRRHARAANCAWACVVDRRLDHSQPGIRSRISRHRPTANGLYAGRLAPLQRPDPECEPDCCLPATEYTPALSGLSSRIRDRRCFAACRSKRSDRTVAAVRWASATVCHAPRRPAASILRRRQLLVAFAVSDWSAATLP